MKDKKIILIGYMASGKTTLGKLLANKLNIPFIDVDSKIEELEGTTISEIFLHKGERTFRLMETDFLKNYNFPESFVLSTGGGMPCFNDNMEILNALGATFYLKRPVKELVNRLVGAKEKRPLVVGKSIEELEVFITDALKIRTPFYESSKFVLNRENQTVEEIIDCLNSSNE
jgi:shikimate kinase